VRGLSDEQTCWEQVCEEFPSKPVFDHQLVKLATARWVLPTFDQTKVGCSGPTAGHTPLKFE